MRGGNNNVVFVQKKKWKKEAEGEVKVRGKCNYRRNAQLDAALLAWRMKEGNQGPRNVGGL